MELRGRAAARLRLVPLAALAAALLAPAPALAASDLHQPASQTKPPSFYRLSARQATAIAARTAKVRAERRRGRGLKPVAYTKGSGDWQISWFRKRRQVVQVLIDDRSGGVTEQWSGEQVAWTMARGYSGAFGRKLNAPYVWIPLCALFLVPFFDPRRPFRLLHLDLLVLLGFGVSHFFFNRGEIGLSVPLAYPVLLYLLGRVLLAGFRPRARLGSPVPLVPTTWLVIGIVFLAAFRIGLNVADSNVIDVGYAGVIGADRVMDGDPLYGPGFSTDVDHGDTYGPVNYLLYVPFEQALPWSGIWDDLPAAHGAAIAFDLLTLAGLVLLGGRLRPGPHGRRLGLGLGWAWVACPYSAFALESNSNDSLVAMLVVVALLAVTAERDSRALSAVARGAALGLGAAAKFAPLALAPLFAAGASGRRWRSAALFALALAAVIAATVLPFAPDGGLRELYDRTLGYQAGRPSPFSVWGQTPSLEWLHTAVKAAAVGLALAVAIVPRRRTPRQLAALGAAVLLLVELAATHWFYLYVVWFLPLFLVAALTAYREPEPPEPAVTGESRAEPELVGA
ncbi:MAG: glycosyltransferase 87 family protein [Thermoleophilaceae bacterium]